MDQLGQIPTPHLTDREILLLTYQQLQNVSTEFRSHKESSDLVLHDLDTRIDKIEKILVTQDAIKGEIEARGRKQLQKIAIIFTAINLLLVITGIVVSIVLHSTK